MFATYSETHPTTEKRVDHEKRDGAGVGAWLFAV